MNKTRLGVSILAAVLLNPYLPVSRARKADKTTILKMEDDSDYRVISVSCRIKGDRRRHVCVIDSGATTTSVSDRLIEADGRVFSVTTGNGEISGHRHEVSLTIGDGLNVKTDAFVQSMMPRGIDILVGQDVLRQFRLVIFDYQKRQIELQK